MLYQLLNFLIFLSVICSILFYLKVYSVHIDVQKPPFDTVKYKRDFNRVNVLCIGIPFGLAFLFLITGQLLGIIILTPSIAISVYTISKKQINLTASVTPQRIQQNEKFTLIIICDLLLTIIYSVIKTFKAFLKAQ